MHLWNAWKCFEFIYIFGNSMHNLCRATIPPFQMITSFWGSIPFGETLISQFYQQFIYNGTLACLADEKQHRLGSFMIKLVKRYLWQSTMVGVLEMILHFTLAETLQSVKAADLIDHTSIFLLSTINKKSWNESWKYTHYKNYKLIDSA